MRDRNFLHEREILKSYDLICPKYLTGSEVRFPPVERPDHGKRPLDGAPGSRKRFENRSCERIGGGGIYRGYHAGGAMNESVQHI